MLELAKPIIIIGKEGCKACEQAKEFFAKHTSNFIYTKFQDLNLEYRRYLTEQFRDRKDEVGYPIILFPQGEDYVVIFGFSEQMFKVA